MKFYTEEETLNRVIGAKGTPTTNMKMILTISSWVKPSSKPEAKLDSGTWRINGSKKRAQISK